MALEQIGLEAVLKDSDFQAGLKRYTEGLGKIEKLTDKAATSVGRAFSDLGAISMGVANVGLTALGVGIGAVTAGLAVSVKAAMESENTMTELSAVIKSTGGAAGLTAEEVAAMATELQNVTKFEDDATIKGQSMLLTFTNIGRDVFPQATEAMLNMAEKFGSMDTAALQLGKALNDPVEGVAALRRVGVQLSDEQEKQIKNFVAVGKTADAQKVILGELEKQFGGLARAAGQTLSGKMTIFQNKLGDIQETIGGALLPVLSTLADGLLAALDNPAVQAAIDNITNGIALFAESIASLASGDVTGFLGGLSDSLFDLLQVFGMDAFAAGDLAEQITGTLAKAFQFVADEVLPRLQQAIAFVADHWEEFKGALIGVGAVLAGAGLVALIGAIGTAIAGISLPILAIVAAAAVLGAAWAADWGGIRTTLTEVWEGTLLPALQTLWAWLQVNVPAAIQTLSNFWNNTLLPALNTIWQFINTYIIPIFSALVNVWIAELKLAVTALAGLWQNVLYPALQAVWKFIQDNILPILDALWKFIKDNVGPVLEKLGSVILPAITGAFEGIGRAVQTVIGWLNDLAGRINSLTLPPWLTPGSPTPFEEGLVGVASATEALTAALNSQLKPALQRVADFLQNDLNVWLGADTGLIYLLRTVGQLSTAAMGWAVNFEGAFYVMRAAIADAAAVADGLLSTLDAIRAIGTITTHIWVITHEKTIIEPTEDHSSGAPTGGGGGIPAMEHGGPIASTGIILGHAGEFVLSRGMVGDLGTLLASQARMIQSIAGASAGQNIVYHNREANYNLNVTTVSPAESIIGDFGLMSSMAAVG